MTMWPNLFGPSKAADLAARRQHATVEAEHAEQIQ